jgi:hypothetical protein
MYAVTHRPKHRLAILSAGLFLALSSQAIGKEVRITAGYEYSSGDYGQAVTTEIETVPVQMQVLYDALSFSLTVPYIRVTGNGTVIPGAAGPLTFSNFGSGFFGGGGSGASSTETVTNAGLGDITASVGYALPAKSGFYEISAKVKLGTADADKGLGTGENDYFLQFDAIPGTGKSSPYFTVGYVITGDNATYTYKDVVYGSVGIMTRNGQDGSMGIGYDYRQSTVAGSDDLQQISAFVDWKTSRNWSTSLSGLVGLSDSSPDYGISLKFTHRH